MSKVLNENNGGMAPTYPSTWDGAGQLALGTWRLWVDGTGHLRRVSTEQLARGSSLRSQTSASTAQEFEARAVLLQSQLDYVQAADEMDVAIGRRPQ
jgi:hypothetical protein